MFELLDNSFVCSSLVLENVAGAVLASRGRERNLNAHCNFSFQGADSSPTKKKWQS
jgi:hypothetical protein